MCVFVFFQQAGRRGATVSDAAVVWAGKKKKRLKKKRKRKEMATRGSEGVRREVADSKRKISRRGS